ncbi:MAG TPA: LUD domain-containing protein, partial [Paludibacteraceae bacterium]|nr:LUD domain-containing protein [Paludibacteraceae bacterium]HPT43040.1 LUD domain-containing protein [Paludibacteraceae bacterium]
MTAESRKFGIAAGKIAFDEKHRSTIKFNISRYEAAFAKGLARYKNVNSAKSTAAAIKRDVLKNWDKYLLEFEKNITANGAEVLWAENETEATAYIRKILTENEARLLVKSKSMTTEEIELNETAKSLGVESVETDLGEFIVQVAGEKPYHIVTPAMHKSKKDIAVLFNEKFNTPADSTPEELTDYVRGVLRKKYTA